jgi:hypothetical protein
MRNPTIERNHQLGMGGKQKLYRFANGYGASVVRFPHSYGWEDGLWELAVLRFTGPKIDDFYLVYDTPITDDVLGYLSEQDVDDTLAGIEALPAK